MTHRVLVAYASRSGSTAEVAETIGQIIRESGAEVEVCSVKEGAYPGDFDALVLGTAIWMGKPLPEALQFLTWHRQALANIPVAYFILCDKLSVDTPENRAAARGYVTPLENIRPAINIGLFAGAKDLSKLNALLRWLLKHVVHLAEGDWRDWGQIRAWGRTLARTLAPTREGAPADRLDSRRQSSASPGTRSR
jgi:menaquinone-dependent protoporphyrinogen oxidase